MNTQPIEVAIAILHSEGGYLMQLRDNISGIVYPGCWGLFGGHIEAGETPEYAIERELSEEISYIPPSLSQFGCYREPAVIRHVFHATLTVGLEQLVLQEGWDMGLLTPQQIKTGSCYSEKADQTRPLGHLHQKILLDFMAQQPFVES
ncbi:NUDIX domain-containing protein [Lyngbya aestuarii]|uniref:NUDIX domain-containing protein n=1 Tax=Lyngbya aestuarii TaxID=118322 RepID=UPI00403E019F